MLRKAVLIVFTLLLASNAFAWGNDGHRITGHLASTLLNENTRLQLRRLLGHDDLSIVATRMDEARESFEQRYPGSSRWHYENRLVCGGEVSCPRNQCVTRQIDLHVRTLRDPKSTLETKSEAIAVIVHLVGDLHQPLHLTDNRDRGGNDAWALLKGESEPRRLHEVWDTRLVRLNMRRKSAAAYAASLKETFDTRIELWASGDVSAWAAETYRLGRDSAYQTLPGFACAVRKSANGQPIQLPPAYVESAQKLVAEQLAKAGVRIAFILNSALAASAN